MATMTLLLKQFWPYLMSGAAVITGLVAKRFYDAGKRSDGKKEYVNAAVREDHDRQRAILDRLARIKRRQSEINSSIPNNWADVELRRQEGSKIDIRATPKRTD